MHYEALEQLTRDHTRALRADGTAERLLAQTRRRRAHRRRALAAARELLHARRARLNAPA